MLYYKASGSVKLQTSTHTGYKKYFVDSTQALKGYPEQVSINFMLFVSMKFDK